MKTPAQLLNAYLDNIQNPAAAAALFAEDGVLELPSLGPNVRAVGPVAIEAFIGGLLKNVPDFRFHNVQLFIETADQAFGEYSVEANVLSTGKLYKQTYAGRLVAKDGKITLLREALDTLAASNAFTPD
ncbi:MULTISPECIES: nuclear transport factor 2 family protein [unclassified Duganella]|uniref:nuclear transport factor 2 family protein n=1 Tax=unclassified Duganella TaxID=2636909 RepID=UPI000891EE17|nr:MULTISPECIES: nuclear transport factor 2 family protein [unclassified Duganella]SDG03634.1 Ketosteroid isomerase-related protein [Duganella sp. OV458]SDJ01693.1 Ketosteroid isomerase-related protein [Duganella sp. OV510]